MIVHAAAGGDAAIAFIELGAVALALAVLARLSSRLGVPAIPFYLVAGLAVGRGGVAPLDVSADFISLAAEIGVLLLLLTLGLEYTTEELRAGLRTSLGTGAADAIFNFTPGLAAGFLLGWDLQAALLLAGVCWVSSSGVVSKVLADLDRLGYRETPGILNLLVFEDLAMAIYLPVVGALLVNRPGFETATTVVVALAAVAVILVAVFRWGTRLSAALARGSDEALLLSIFGITLLVGGLAQRAQVSAAIGAFLVGLGLSGPVQERASTIIAPLRDLFAATFFLFFSFGIEPASLVDVAVPATALAVLTGLTKLGSGIVAGRQVGASSRGQIRAGTTLMARGEFSIVIANLGAGTTHGDELVAVSAGYVLLTAVAGPLFAKQAGRPQRARPSPART